MRVCWLWLPTWVHVCLHDEFEKCSNKLRISRCATSLTSSKLQICPNSRQVWIGKESIRDHARWSIHRVEELFIPEISMDSRKLGNSLRTRIYKTRYLYTIVYERSYSRAKRYKRRQFKIRFPRRQVEPVLPRMAWGREEPCHGGRCQLRHRPRLASSSGYQNRGFRSPSPSPSQAAWDWFPWRSAYEYRKEGCLAAKEFHCRLE